MRDVTIEKFKTENPTRATHPRRKPPRRNRSSHPPPPPLPLPHSQSHYRYHHRRVAPTYESPPSTLRPRTRAVRSCRPSARARPADRGGGPRAPTAASRGLGRVFPCVRGRRVGRRGFGLAVAVAGGGRALAFPLSFFFCAGGCRRGGRREFGGEGIGEKVRGETHDSHVADGLLVQHCRGAALPAAPTILVHRRRQVRELDARGQQRGLVLRVLLQQILRFGHVLLLLLWGCRGVDGVLEGHVVVVGWGGEGVVGDLCGGRGCVSLCWKQREEGMVGFGGTWVRFEWNG